MSDITPQVAALFPPPQGDPTVSHRQGVLTSVSGDTAYVTVSGASIPMPYLAGAVLTPGPVQVLAWKGALLCLGATGNGPNRPLPVSVTVSGSSVTVTDIPQTFNDLRVVWHGHHDDAGRSSVWLRKNGSTTSTDYRWVANRAFADATNPIISQATAGSASGFFIGSAYTNTASGFGEVYISGYTAGGQWVAARSYATGGTATNANQFEQTSGRFLESAAVTSLQFDTGLGDWAAFSLEVYGI